MAGHAVVDSVFIREDVAVARAVSTKCSYDNIADRKDVAAGVIHDSYRPCTGGALAAEGLRLEGPGTVEVGGAANIIDQLADRPVGRGQIDFHVSGEGRGERDLHGDPVDL